MLLGAKTYEAAKSDVQWPQRVALIGTGVQQYGQSLVVGAATSFFFSRLICLITRKIAKATMRKSSTVLMNAPYLISDVVVQRDVQTGKIGFSHQQPHRRHNDVVDQRRNDFSECRPDHDADRHVDDIPLHGELFELADDPHCGYPIA